MKQYITYTLLYLNDSVGIPPTAQIKQNFSPSVIFEAGIKADPSKDSRYLGRLTGTQEMIDATIKALSPWSVTKLSNTEALNFAKAFSPTIIQQANGDITEPQ